MEDDRFRRYFGSAAPFIFGLFALVLLGGAAAGYYFHQQFTTEIAKTRAQLATTTDELAQTEQRNAELAEALYSEQQKNAQLEEEMDTLSKTLDTLEKLQRLDRELLQKYSRVYFLNEHYQPDKLTEIKDPFVYPEGELEYLHTEVWPFLEDLLDNAQNDNIDLRIVSAYRTFDHQNALLSNYTITYGQGANQFSAAQGYSEHQLGTTVDFSTPELNGALQGFENTEAYMWLVENAHTYGFVLSYPPNNAYYQFEPWHWRFVGVKLATELNENDQYFYDLDQKTIDRYLLDIFEQ